MSLARLWRDQAKVHQAREHREAEVLDHHLIAKTKLFLFLEIIFPGLRRCLAIWIPKLRATVRISPSGCVVEIASGGVNHVAIALLEF
jgi:hypothetical protein